MEKGDTLSALMALWGAEGGRTSPDIVGDILMIATKLERRGYTSGFMWVPAHVGVQGNKRTVRAAK